MIIDYTNKTVLITGGTRGIGKQIAIDMKAAGAKVIVTGRSKIHSLELDQIGIDEYIAVDFLDIEQTNAFIEDIKKKEIDVCINNAGINQIGEIPDFPIDKWEDVIRMNLTIPFMITQALSKYMIEQNYGRIINVASISSTMGVGGRVAYSSSKHGMLGLTEVSSTEFSKHNVLVNTVSPGITVTDMTYQALGEDGMVEKSKLMPIGRLATVEDISNVVMFFASDKNSYVAGQNICVDGGFLHKGFGSDAS